MVGLDVGNCVSGPEYVMSTQDMKKSNLPVILGISHFALVVVAYTCMKSGGTPAGNAGLSLTALQLSGYRALAVLTQPAYAIWSLLGLQGCLSPRAQWLIFFGNSMLWGYVLAWACGKTRWRISKEEDIT